MKSERDAPRGPASAAFQGVTSSCSAAAAARSLLPRMSSGWGAASVEDEPLEPLDPDPVEASEESDDEGESDESEEPDVSVETSEETSDDPPEEPSEDPSEDPSEEPSDEPSEEPPEDPPEELPRRRRAAGVPGTPATCRTAASEK